MAQKKEIVDNGYDLKLNTYIKGDYEEVEYEKPSVTLKKLIKIEISINNGIHELTELTK